MSVTPIFDAVLADADKDIHLASPVFPTPVEGYYTRLWREAKVVGGYIGPANLSILESIQ